MKKEIHDKIVYHDNAPSYVTSNIEYLTLMGSHAYGLANEDSDIDVYGFCIPPNDVIFKHLRGELDNFGRQQFNFVQWLQHHIPYKETTIDCQVYNVCRYFHLLMENNPNIIDSIWTPDDCIVYISEIGKKVRKNRQIFLHKGLYHKFKGFSHSQLHKADCKNPKEGTKRHDLKSKYGMDTKFLCHSVRLMYESEMLLSECDMDERRYKDHVYQVKTGQVPYEDIIKWIHSKQLVIDKLYETSSLPYGPDEEKIKQLLVECIEEKNGKW